MERLLVTVPFNEGHMEKIRAAAGADVEVVQRVEKLRENELAELMNGFDIVIGEPALKALLKTPSVKWVQMTWAGTDAYTEMRARFPEGVRLTNAVGAYGHTISQYVVGQVLSVMQNLPNYVRQQQSMLWRDLGPVATLEGAVVLIFGAGNIGGMVAKRLAGFDVDRIVGVCKHAAEPREHFDQLVTLIRAEELLPLADVVVGCMPNMPETKRYLNERRLMKMKEGAVLVNVGRGSFVDTDALGRVLKSGHLRGAALDVTDPEPLPLQHPLWREPHCVITPHVSGGAFGKSDGTENRICDICCENLRRWRAGEPLINQVF